MYYHYILLWLIICIDLHDLPLLLIVFIADFEAIWIIYRFGACCVTNEKKHHLQLEEPQP